MSVLVAAAIAGEFGYEVVAPPTRGTSAHDGVALRFQLPKGGLRRLHLPVEVDAARRPAQRAPEQEHILVAIGPVGVGLHPLVIRLGLPHVVFDARKLLLARAWRAAAQLRLKLGAAPTRSAMGLGRRGRSPISWLLLSPARRIEVAAVAPSPALSSALIRSGGDHRQSANDAETAKKSFHVNPPPRGDRSGRLFVNATMTR